MKKVGRPKKDTEQVTLRLLVETIQAIDQVRKEERDLPSRPEMIRRMIADWFERRDASDR